MSARQNANLAPDRTHLGRVTAIDAQPLIQNKIPQRLSLLVAEIASEHEFLLFFLVIREAERLDALLFDCLEAVLSLVLWLCGLSKSVALLVCEIVNLLFDFLVFFIVRIIPLHVLAELFVELFQNAAMLLDLFVSSLDGIQHHILGNFFRLAFDHHDIFLGGSDHELDVSLVHLAEARIDLELTINPGYSNLGDRSEEWNVAAGKGSRRRKPCESIRLDVFLCRN